MTSPASVPVIDLCLLSHSEIADLARNDPHAYDLNRLSVVVPKIDRSIFNESAGSRKQTYSRIRKPSPAPRRPSPDRGDRENELIVQFLQHLFEPDKYPRPSDTDPITPPSDRTPPQPRSDQNPVLALAAPPPPPPTGRTATAAAAVTVADTSRALVVVEDNKDKEVLNAKGEVVDVARLGAREEPFADELRRRTEGMKTEEELLRFLAGLDGKWGSSRKKRKFVDAAGFGDAFPRGWKVLLGLRRKEGVPSLYCRRYISDMKPVSVLEESNNELENCFDNSKTAEVGDATVTDGRNSLHANMAQTSWLHSDDSFPIDFIPEQIEDDPSGAGQEHGNITGYEDLRMDVEPPMEFDFMTGHASAPLMEFDFMTYQGSLPSSQHGMSYVAQMEDVNHPSLELDWRLSLPDVVDGGCEFKQCVWCGREFYHDSLSSQLQPNMIGLICPACKENT